MANIKTVVTLTEEDIELLKKPLPKSPCLKCMDRGLGGCCGCDKETEYRNYIEIYEENNILEIARDITRIMELQKQISDIFIEIDSLTKKVSQTIDFDTLQNILGVE